MTTEKERMPDLGFKLMTLFFRIIDCFYSDDNIIEKFGIKSGNTVVDYGCGPGRYIKKVSEVVGSTGKVYAVDIHEIAMQYVKSKIKKYKLDNVTPVLAKGYSCDIENDEADLIYALDMFHMIKNPTYFLKELNRLIKKDGVLIIEDGHQARKKSKKKIIDSQFWQIIEETKRYLKCKSLKYKIKSKQK